ncbi:metal-dependent hydrolase [Psychroserpens luteus]|uniref:Metal-dependent hydrolase n=1 Tax=Psychroserpens luteus TaxID=1434066 RepID=A0ABW6A178_9FLAO|nr:metal-dependent hydrolase [Psychroserpens luteus]
MVLGAAFGEGILDEKRGNKALLFGVIRGAILNLNVFFGKLFYYNEMDLILFHRGFMHSILFFVLAAFVLCWLVHKL